MKKIIISVFASLMVIVTLSGCSSAGTGGNDDPRPAPQKTAKADADREWIYDAEYEADFTVESYTARDGVSYHSRRDLVVPYINLASNDASRINNMIKGLYSDLVASFNWFSQEKIWWTTATYRSYEYNNTVSVLMTIRSGGTAAPEETYYGFCFDINDGHQLSFSQACQKIGSSEDEVQKKLGPLISDAIRKEAGMLDERYVEATLHQLNSAINNGYLQFVIDAQGRLTLVIDLIIEDLENGIYSVLITVD